MAQPTALTEKSPNIPSDAELLSRKRSHDEYSGDVVKLDHEHEAKRPSSASIACQNGPLPAPVQAIANDPSPNTSPALTEGGNTATSNSSPPTPTKPSSPSSGIQTTSTTAPAATTGSTATASTAQPKKKAKLTPAEREARNKEAQEKKEAREKELEQKQKEKEEKQRLAVEKKKQQEEEREEKRKKKEEADKIKAQKAQEKEDKKREAQEAKEKEARKQKKLNGFFITPSTPKKAPVATTKEVSPKKAAAKPESADAEYRKMFQPFFLKDSTTIATGPTQMDTETMAAKSNILDEFLDGKRSQDSKALFDPVSLFTLHDKPPPKGTLHHPVRHIMESALKAEPSTETDAMTSARKQLSGVPMKVIAFSQDVRPPYFGTATFKPYALGKSHMRSLARMSTAKRLPLDYDYDSEAEWQEEEGEDLDAEDDEEEVDDEDDMDGFLDDADDAGPARIFANAMEPESTGICYADNGHAFNAVALQHKMEIIIDNFDRDTGLDPWSSTYWHPEPKATPVSNGAKMPPPAAPSDAFAALKVGAPGGPAVKLAKPEIIGNIKQAIVDNKSLSKVGIVEVLYQMFRGNASRNEVKNTIETVAEKTGSGRSVEWILRPGHEIA